MRWMREEVRHQKYRYDPRSPDWVGLAPAKHLGLDPRADRKKLNAIRASVYWQRKSKDGGAPRAEIPGSWKLEHDPDAA